MSSSKALNHLVSVSFTLYEQSVSVSVDIFITLALSPRWITISSIAFPFSLIDRLSRAWILIPFPPFVILRLAAYSTQWATPAVPSRRHNSLKSNEREPNLGWREDYRSDLLLHTRQLLFNSLQAYSSGFWMGSHQQRCRCRSCRICTFPLRESANAVIWPIPWILHGPWRWDLELQLHGREAFRWYGVRPPSRYP